MWLTSATPVADMRKAVNAALHTKYESSEWKKWFVEEAKRLLKKLDGDSTDANVHLSIPRIFY